MSDQTDPMPGANSSTEAGQEPFQPLLGPISSTLVSSIQYPAPFRVLVNDEGFIQRLLEDLLKVGGLSVKEAARQLGVRDEALRQYVKGRRSNPSIGWLIRFAALCGFELVIRKKKDK